MNSEKEIEINDELIARYLSGEASPEEALALTDWLQQPHNKLHFEKFESTWNEVAAVKKPTFNSHRAWDKLDVPKEKTRTRFLGMSSGMFRVAASFILVAVCSVLLYLNFGRNIQQTTFATHDETALVDLPDQSKITLYHQTTINYPVEFDKHERKVNLAKGEAFFEIAPDKQKPFVVHTAAADIKVVGTKFNVVAREDRTEISVEEGNVLVYTGSDSASLTTGLTSIVHRKSESIHTTTTTSVNAWAYATQKLIFRNTPLKLAIQDIQKTYACTIDVKNPAINNCTITVTFERDSVEKIITLVAEVLNLTIKKDGDVYILEGEGCP